MTSTADAGFAPAPSGGFAPQHRWDRNYFLAMVALIWLGVLLGFGWDVVSKENARLIYASVSGYGQTGPYAARAGYDPCIQAEVGMIEATGPMGGEMCRVGTAPVE